MRSSMASVRKKSTPSSALGLLGITNTTSLDAGPELYKDAPICVQLVGYRHADEALANSAAVLDRIINSD